MNILGLLLYCKRDSVFYVTVALKRVFPSAQKALLKIKCPPINKSLSGGHSATKSHIHEALYLKLFIYTACPQVFNYQNLLLLHLDKLFM